MFGNYVEYGNTCSRSLHCQIVGCHNSHDVRYASQLIMQKELLFNISRKIAYFLIVSMFCYINLYYYYLAICTSVLSSMLCVCAVLCAIAQ